MSEMPYGLGDVSPDLVKNAQGRVKCCVAACPHFLKPPTRYFSGETCPDHLIRTHTSSTYTFHPEHARRNAIYDAKLFEGLNNHPFKFESRMHYEKSEDAVTANVFVSFRQAGCLKDIALLITGDNTTKEPKLYLWGIEIADDLKPHDLLVMARRRFESRLPVKRPATEPDVMLSLPGRSLVLCEAMLTSSNPHNEEGPRKDAQSLTKDELLDTYSDMYSGFLDVKQAQAAPRVAYQLWRNATFSAWMASNDVAGTEPHVANLTCHGKEEGSQAEFRRLVLPDQQHRFRGLTWEQLYGLTGRHKTRLSLLRRYMEKKTCNLKKVFRS